MTVAFTVRRHACLAISVCALAALSACTPDTEEGFRAEVGAWLALGPTHYFHAETDCTAGVFEARSGVLASAMRSVTSWREAQRWIDADRAVAFESVSLTPSDFTGILMDEEPTLGTKIISGGLAIRDCLSEPMQAEYHAALRDPDAALLYDPSTQTVGILQGDRQRVYIGRGEPK